LFYSLNISIKT